KVMNRRRYLIRIQLVCIAAGCCDSRGHRVCQPSLSSQQTSVDPNSVFCHRLREDRKGRLVTKSDGLPHVPKFLLASAVRGTGGLGGLPRTQAHSDPPRRRALLATSDQRVMHHPSLALK